MEVEGRTRERAFTRAIQKALTEELRKVAFDRLLDAINRHSQLKYRGAPEDWRPRSKRAVTRWLRKGVPWPVLVDLLSSSYPVIPHETRDAILAKFGVKWDRVIRVTESQVAEAQRSGAPIRVEFFDDVEVLVDWVQRTWSREGVVMDYRRQVAYRKAEQAGLPVKAPYIDADGALDIRALNIRRGEIPLLRIRKRRDGQCFLPPEARPKRFVKRKAVSVPTL